MDFRAPAFRWCPKCDSPEDWEATWCHFCGRDLDNVQVVPAWLPSDGEDLRPAGSVESIYRERDGEVKKFLRVPTQQRRFTCAVCGKKTWAVFHPPVHFDPPRKGGVADCVTVPACWLVMSHERELDVLCTASLSPWQPDQFPLALGDGYETKPKAVKADKP